LPAWVAAFLRPLFTRMKRFLEGGKGKPPDYERCRWVRYCYLLGRSELGAVLFSSILSDHVEPKLYQQTERLARILKLRLGEAAPTTSTFPMQQSVACDGPLPPPGQGVVLGCLDKLRKWVEQAYPAGF